MRFEFATAPRIVFGPGTLAELPGLAGEFGRHALLVTGSNPARAARVIALLTAATPTISATTFSIAREPTLDDVARGVATARGAGCDFVIGYGGGSALDAAKAISALLTNPGSALDYLEVIGRGQSLTRPTAPFLAIPTTAGTGTEVTRNAVLSSPAHRSKASLRSPLLLPRLALIDPELTHDLPPAVTAATGLDALTQLIEPFVSCRANPVTDALCRDGIARAARALPRACADGHDAAAREEMALASLHGGLALANSGLGAVHAFANPLGGMFPAPHGAVCAALLPHVFAANLAALRERTPASPALGKFNEIARLLTGDSTATADAAVPWLHQLTRSLGIPSLARYGVSIADIPSLVNAAANASSMKANPLPLTTFELTAILHAALVPAAN